MLSCIDTVLTMKLFSRAKKRNLQDWTDEQLFAEWQGERDEACFQLLYERHYHLVYGICCKYLDQVADRQDKTLEVFSALMDTPPGRTIRSIPKWLNTLTRNTCISYLRQQANAPALSSEESFFENNAPNFVENEGLLRHINREHPQLTDLLPQALAQLNEQQRQCLELFYLEELSYKEVSQATGYELKAVKSYLQNGRRNLLAALKALRSERF